ncbi:serine hydrolase [Longispora albida]|uniref:serine hydrolase n=1 Tax=Longispora albida TaxID=203523 RepID=UPI000374F279|nr:serine hydrolase [Longispora albida]
MTTPRRASPASSPGASPSRAALLTRVALLTLSAVLVGAGLAYPLTSGPVTHAAGRAARSPSPESAHGSASCVAGGWDCSWSPRFAAASALVGPAPGNPAFILYDRRTGARHTAGPAGRVSWTGSTSKLALVTYALEEARSGAQPLTADIRDDLGLMLHVSDDEAATRVWEHYGADDLTEVFRDRYGMTGLEMAGTNNDWGALACRPADLVALMTHVLDRLHPEDRAWVVAAMRSVGDVQRWGVWGAGPAQRPGVKNGWLDAGDDVSGWNTITVGFFGPGERYVLAAMYPMPAEPGSIAAGGQLLTDLAAILAGQPTPAPATFPDE